MRYFKEDEFTCSCGCGLNKMDKDFLRDLDDARYYAGIPFVINSGYRCKSHNFDVGGSATSSHLTGHAVDIKCLTSHNRFQILQALLKIGFNRIGIGPDFIHVDNDRSKSKMVIWLYA